MRLFAWPVLALLLGCAGHEGADYSPQPCPDCEWTVPYGSAVDAEQVASDGEHLYWVQRWTQRLMRVPVGGGEPEPVAYWLESSRGLLVDATAVFSCESDPPQRFANRLTRFAKPGFETTVLSQGDVGAPPALREHELVYFERASSGNLLWRQPAAGGERELLLQTDSARFPSSPVWVGEQLAWCALVDSVVTVFRHDLATASTTGLALPAESACPDLVVLEQQLFALTERDAGTLLSLQGGMVDAVAAGLFAAAGSSWSASMVADRLALLTELGGSTLLLVDAQGRVVWRKQTAFPIQARADADDSYVFAAGERALARFDLPAEALP